MTAHTNTKPQVSWKRAFTSASSCFRAGLVSSSRPIFGVRWCNTPSVLSIAQLCSEGDREKDRQIPSLTVRNWADLIGCERFRETRRKSEKAQAKAGIYSV